MKILFYGFQHGHMDGLYKLAQQTEGIEIAACVEEDPKAREAVSARLGIVFDEGSYEEWLKTDIDIVAIGGKFGLRGAAAIKALAAGKHVISDKPVCTSLEELERIEELTGEKNVKLACMLDLRYLASSGKAREILRAGKLGSIRNISFTGQHCMDYAHRPSWYFEEGMHGGTINDLAIHGLDLVRDLTGLEITQVDGIRTWNSYAYKNPEFKDCAVFMARLTGGAELLADVSYSAPSQVFSMPTYWDFKFWCERGLLTFHLTDSHVTIYEEGIKEPQVLEGIEPETNFLLDLMKEIEEDTDAMTTSVIASTRTALLIQQKGE